MQISGEISVFHCSPTRILYHKNPPIIDARVPKHFPLSSGKVVYIYIRLVLTFASRRDRVPPERNAISQGVELGMFLQSPIKLARLAS